MALDSAAFEVTSPSMPGGRFGFAGSFSALTYNDGGLEQQVAKTVETAVPHLDGSKR
jgi:hypothetical protein